MFFFSLSKFRDFVRMQYGQCQKKLYNSRSNDQTFSYLCKFLFLFSFVHFIFTMSSLSFLLMLVALPHLTQNFIHIVRWCRIGTWICWCECKWRCWWRWRWWWRWRRQRRYCVVWCLILETSTWNIQQHHLPTGRQKFKTQNCIHAGGHDNINTFTPIYLGGCWEQH